MYNQYTREDLIKKIQHQEDLLAYKEKDFYHVAPTILYRDDINAQEYFLKLFKETLHIAQKEKKHVDIQSWFEKKDAHHITDTIFISTAVSTGNEQAIAYMSKLISNEIDNINKTNSIEAYSCFFLSLTKYLEALNYYLYTENANIISFLCENINKIENQKEKAFMIKYIRDTIISNENLNGFIHINNVYGDILQLKENPDSLHLMTIHRHAINRMIKYDNKQDPLIENLIKTVVNTGVFDNEIESNSLHYYTIFEKKLSIFDDENKKNLANYTQKRSETMSLL